MLIGYTRVSTADQDLALQTDALTKAGCGKLFTDKASGAKIDRPGLAEALHFARAGDTLVVWKLDRLSGLSRCSIVRGPVIAEVSAGCASTCSAEQAGVVTTVREARSEAFGRAAIIRASPLSSLSWPPLGDFGRRHHAF